MSRQEQHAQNMAQMFRVLGDQTRLRALLALRAGELNVSEICTTLRMPQPTVSRHLGILRMAGLVSNRRSGKEIFYSLHAAHGRTLKTILQAATRA